MRPRAREHDRRQPAPDRHRLVDGGVHRVVPAAQDQDGCARPPWEGIRLTRDHSIELGFLWVATLYSLTLPLKSLDHADRHRRPRRPVRARTRGGSHERPAEEPHLVGPARYLGTFPVTTRRAWVIGLFLGSGVVILLFAASVRGARSRTPGSELGINEFLLVQWLAPLASEAPELLVAGLFAWRLNTNAGLGTLVSSKVNQWTLLVGTLPIVFAISSASLARPADQRDPARGALPHGRAVVLRGRDPVEPLAVPAGGRLPVRALLGAVHRRGARAGVDARGRADRRRHPLPGARRGLHPPGSAPHAAPASATRSWRRYAELGEERLQDALGEAEEDHPSPPHDTTTTPRLRRPGSVAPVDARGFLEELTALDPETAALPRRHPGAAGARADASTRSPRTSRSS